MTTSLVARRIALAMVLWLLAGSAPAAFAMHQDPFARAKALYASAEFEEALRILDALKDPAENLEAATYKVYSLVALGREDDARRLVERIVQVDPLYRPTDQVAPRMRTFFEETRKPLLPEAARRCFATAKVAYDKKDATLAFTEFNRVIALLDEIRGGGIEMPDLRMLTLAFRDLALVSAEPIVYDISHASVTPPVPVSTPQPVWRPFLFELNRSFYGSIAVVVNEEGRVLSATLVKSVHDRYDEPLLEAAKSWTFKPALRSGVPVRYRYVMPVRVLR